MHTLYRLMRRRGAWALLTLCLSVCAAAATLWWNGQLSRLIDAITQGEGIPRAVLWRAMAAILTGAALAFTRGCAAGWTLESVAHDLRMGCAAHIAGLPLAEVEAMRAGEQLSKLQNEVEEVSGFLRANLFSLADDLVRLVATLAWLLWLHPALVLLANLPSLLLMGYSLLSSRVIGRAAAQSQAAVARMNGHAEAAIGAFAILRLFDGVPLLKARYRAELDGWETATRREERTKAALMSLSGVIASLPLLLIFLIGGTLVIRGELSVGVLLVFINLSGNISGVMQNLPGRFAAFRRFAANMRRLAHSISLDERRVAP